MPTDYTDYSVPQFAQSLTNQVMNLSQLLGQQKREARLEKLQEQQGILQQFQGLQQIGKAPVKLRGPLFDAWAQSYEQLQGRPMNPETREVWKKAIGDDETQGQMLDTLGEVLKGNIENINPRTFAPLFEDKPLEAMKSFMELSQQAQFQRAMKDDQAGAGTVPGTATAAPAGPAAGPGLQGALETRIGELDKKIAKFSAIGGPAKKFADDLQQERNSLITRMGQEQTKTHQQATEAQAQANLENMRRHQAATEAIAKANLGVSQANLGVSKQSLALRQRESILTPEGLEARMTLQREEGKAKADVALENLRYTPQQQTQLQSLNDTLTSAEALKGVSDEQINKWVGVLKNPIERAKQLVSPDPEFLEFQNTVNQLKAGMLFSRTEGGGGALTETELNELSGFIPTGKETGGPAQFRAKVDQIVRRLNSKLSTVEGLAKAKPGQATDILKQRREEALKARKEGGAKALENAMEKMEEGWK